MKALVRLSPKAKDMHLIDYNQPSIPYDNWVKVKVSYCGICGSDIRYFNSEMDGGMDSKLKTPVIPGHESSGVICQIGPAVKDFKVGDRVVYHTTIGNCGHCKYCLEGHPGMCSQRKGIGSSYDGGFAEYLVCPSENCVKVADNIPLKTAALIEPLACSIRLLQEVGDIKQGDRIVIFGPGAIGATCAIVAKIMGAIPVVVGTNHSRHRLAILAEKGIKTFVNDENLNKNIMDYFHQEPDVTVDAIGKESTFNQCLYLLRSGGKLIVGATSSEIYKFDPIYLIEKQICILSAHSSSPSGWHKGISMMENHLEYFEGIASEEYDVEDWQIAFEKASSREAFKILIKF